MSTTITSAPSRADASACALPWPRAPPVTMTTLSLSRPIGSSLGQKFLGLGPPQVVAAHVGAMDVLCRPPGAASAGPAVANSVRRGEPRWSPPRSDRTYGAGIPIGHSRSAPPNAASLLRPVSSAAPHGAGCAPPKGRGQSELSFDVAVTRARSAHPFGGAER